MSREPQVLRWIISTFAERMASADASDALAQASPWPVFVDGLDHVFTACWPVSTLSAEERAECVPIDVDPSDQQSSRDGPVGFGRGRIRLDWCRLVLPVGHVGGSITDAIDWPRRRTIVGIA